MKIIFHWHAFVEIESEKWSILIDPFITNNPQCDIKLEDILSKNIIWIINTHWHWDHIWDSPIISQKSWAKIIATYELSQWYIKEKWIENIHSMHIWWEFNFGNYSVKFVPAVHWGGIADIGNWYTTFAAWVIVRINWKNIYHAGDTWLTYDMKLLWDYDKIDLAFLPIWWNFTMWINDAVIATKFIKPKIVVPMHYDTWDIIKADPIEFSRLVMLENISTPKILKPGQYIPEELL